MLRLFYIMLLTVTMVLSSLASNAVGKVTAIGPDTRLDEVLADKDLLGKITNTGNDRNTISVLLWFYLNELLLKVDDLNNSPTSVRESKIVGIYDWINKIALIMEHLNYSFELDPFTTLAVGIPFNVTLKEMYERLAESIYIMTLFASMGGGTGGMVERDANNAFNSGYSTFLKFLEKHKLLHLIL